jgi:hypothetical protein
MFIEFNKISSFLKIDYQCRVVVDQNLEKCFLLEVICPPAQGSWWWMWTTDGRKK